jgi:hypothetical protein
MSCKVCSQMLPEELRSPPEKILPPLGVLSAFLAAAVLLPAMRSAQLLAVLLMGLAALS